MIEQDLVVAAMARAFDALLDRLEAGIAEERLAMKELLRELRHPL
jgi:hypothetical protein